MSDHFASDDPTTFDPAAAPETIVLKVDHMRLELAWRDGKAAEVSAACLAQILGARGARAPASTERSLRRSTPLPSTS